MNDKNDLERFIDQVVKVDGLADGIDTKAALLGFVLDELQRVRAATEPPIKFEQFIQCNRFIDLDSIVFTAPRSFRWDGFGTKPIQLQVPLLLFLLIHHHKKWPVLRLINRFIDLVTPRLQPLDFKKTKTGVTRCHTNTRFAANVLRKYGLLRYTRREAFKTWELSIAGCLAAARIYARCIRESTPWTIPSHEKIENFELQEEIREAAKGLDDYDSFVQRLRSICEPDSNVFETFKPTLEYAYRLLQDYWRDINNPGITQRDRQRISYERIEQLEAHDAYNAFYEDFSSCIQINTMLDHLSADDGLTGPTSG